MKHLVLAAALGLLLFSCKKTDLQINQTPVTLPGYLLSLQANLKDSLSKSDYGSLDFSNYLVSDIDSLHIKFVRISITGDKLANNFFIAKTNNTGQILAGRFVSVVKDSTQKNAFTGSVTYRQMRGVKIKIVNVVKGKVAKKPTAATDMLLEEPIIDGGDLPPVIVYSDYRSGGISVADWYNLENMAAGDGNGFSGYYSPSDGGGGGGSSSTEQVDFEAPEGKDAVDVKKYIDCFGSTQPTNASYTITIAVDLPVDNDPNAFFNWSDASPGHTFIEFYKNDNGNLIQQNLGFYPNTSWKTVVGPDNIASKIVDDATHEYQARYTISVTAAQFQNALQAAQNYSNFQYNVAGFNCADYALDVFNAGGGNLTIPKFQIPGFPSANGSNTPEGVYDAIQSQVKAGKPNAMANSQKQWAGDSHGACD